MDMTEFRQMNDLQLRSIAIERQTWVVDRLESVRGWRAWMPGHVRRISIARAELLCMRVAAREAAERFTVSDLAARRAGRGGRA